MVISDLIGFRTYQALENLHLNLEEMQQDQIVKDFRNQDPLAHAKEFGTIKICGPRQSGHTTAIKTFVKNRILNEKETWVIISPKLAMSQRILTYFLPDNDDSILKRNIDKIEYKNGSSIFFYGIQTFLKEKTGWVINGIIIDCASFIKQKEIEEIYRIGIKTLWFKEYVNFIFVE